MSYGNSSSGLPPSLQQMQQSNRSLGATNQPLIPPQYYQSHQGYPPGYGVPTNLPPHQSAYGLPTDQSGSLHNTSLNNSPYGHSLNNPLTNKNATGIPGYPGHLSSAAGSNNPAGYPTPPNLSTPSPASIPRRPTPTNLASHPYQTSLSSINRPPLMPPGNYNPNLGPIQSTATNPYNTAAPYHPTHHSSYSSHPSNTAVNS